MGMENESGLKVHAVLTVVSSRPVEPGNSCPLSPLDRVMGQHGLHLVFYYRSGTIELDRVRPALNEILTLYPNMTGRLAKDGDGNWEIKCTDAGVRVFLATVGTSVDEWLRSSDGDDEMHLVASQDLPDDPHVWSPFRIQITKFEGGGTATALSCPHMLADPTSVTLFIKSWTDALHREPITHPPFLHPLPLRNPPTATVTTTNVPATYYATKSTAQDPQAPVKMASATFSFSDTMIKQSLAEIHSVLPDASPFDLLTALFWMRITTLKTTPPQNGTQSISICTDMRKRLVARLPYGYFGNALHFSQLTVDDSKLDKGDLSQIVDLVHSHVSGLTEEEFWSAIGWLESRKDDQGTFAPPFRMYGPELTFVEMEDIMYRARFEKDQKPAHVSCKVENTEGEGLILVMPSPEGGVARRVAVTLPEEEMNKLLEDKTILSLEPSLLLTGRK